MPKPKLDHQIVFKKLAEATIELGYGNRDDENEMTAEEAQEIDELRQIALEIENPQTQSYTTT